MHTFFGFVVLGLIVIWAAYTLLMSAESSDVKKSQFVIILAWSVIILFIVASSAFAFHYFIQWKK